MEQPPGGGGGDGSGVGRSGAVAGAVRDDGRGARARVPARWSTDDLNRQRCGPAAERSITRTVEPSHYVIFDLDDTLVHSDAVREAFEIAGEEFGISYRVMMRTLDSLPGRPAREIFEALGLDERAGDHRHRSLPGALDQLNIFAPPVPYPDADMTLRELAAHGAQLMLSTGSSPERAQPGARQRGLGRVHGRARLGRRLQQGHRALRPDGAAGAGSELDAPRDHRRRQPAGHAARAPSTACRSGSGSTATATRARCSPRGRRTSSARWPRSCRSSRRSRPAV